MLYRLGNECLRKVFSYLCSLTPLMQGKSIYEFVQTNPYGWNQVDGDCSLITLLTPLEHFPSSLTGLRLKNGLVNLFINLLFAFGILLRHHPFSSLLVPFKHCSPFTLLSFSSMSRWFKAYVPLLFLQPHFCRAFLDDFALSLRTTYF